VTFNIQFKRTFAHKPWVDTVDRVAAGGDNGFNVRFQALEADLDTLTARINDINDALNTIAPAVQQTITLNINPVMNAISTSPPWTYASGESRKGGAPQVRGIIPLAALPARGTLFSARVTGLATGTGYLTFEVYRKPFNGAAPDLVLQQDQIKAAAGANNRFDVIVLFAGFGFQNIDTDNFTYYLDITGHATDASAANDVYVSGIQINCKP